MLFYLIEIPVKSKIQNADDSVWESPDIFLILIVMFDGYNTTVN